MIPNHLPLRKPNRQVEPVSHEHVTVLFTDFKGFTEISETITPQQLVEEINTCFGAFDEITTKYNVEKIKQLATRIRP